VGLQGAAVVCSFSDEGILYSGGKDWVLYAYRVEQRVLAQNTALSGTAGDHRYGLATTGPSFWADDPFGFESPLLDQRLGTIAGDIEKGQVGTQERSYTAYLLEILDSSVGPRERTFPYPPHRFAVLSFSSGGTAGKNGLPGSSADPDPLF